MGAEQLHHCILPTEGFDPSTGLGNGYKGLRERLLHANYGSAADPGRTANSESAFAAALRDRCARRGRSARFVGTPIESQLSIGENQ